MPQKAYKYRFYPTAEQRRLLAQYFGSARWVWNACLSWRSAEYQRDGASVTGTDFSRELTFLKTLAPFEWLKLTPATVFAQALRDQDRAFRAFFKGIARYPNFKSRRHDQSVRMQLDQRVVMNYYGAGQWLKLPGLGTLELVWTRAPVGVPKMVTVRRDAAGRYWVSMAVEEPIEALTATRRVVGVDLGVEDLAILSDGTRVPNPRHLPNHQRRLRRLQQRLARQKKGSNRRKRTVQRIARLHARIADCRREYLHRVTTQLIRENQVICVEDLNASGMSASAKGDRDNPGTRVRQKAGLNRSILDAGFGEFVRQLDYKAQWYGRTVVKVDRFYPSSKTCSGCGHKLDELRLDIRQWSCPKCGATHDRDTNAARNILTEGLRLITGQHTIYQHPQESGEVRVSGGEGACPVAVSTRKLDPLTTSSGTTS